MWRRRSSKGDEAWYETNTVAAIDAFYSDGEAEANLQLARQLLTTHPRLEDLLVDLDARGRKDREFEYPGKYPGRKAPLFGDQFVKVTRRGYLAAIDLALQHKPPVPIKTLWKSWSGSNFEMLVADGARQVSVTLRIPSRLLGGWELGDPSARGSWVVTENDVNQTSGRRDLPLPDVGPDLAQS